MQKKAKIIDFKTGQCLVYEGDRNPVGYKLQEVEEGYNHLWYLAGKAPKKPAPTIEEQVELKEQEYQMSRWQREIILAEGSGASDYSKAKAQEIENLAKQLRGE